MSSVHQSLQGAGEVNQARAGESGGGREGTHELQGSALCSGGGATADASLTGAGTGTSHKVHSTGREGGRREEGKGRGEAIVQKVKLNTIQDLYRIV